MVLVSTIADSLLRLCSVHSQSQPSRSGRKPRTHTRTTFFACVCAVSVQRCTNRSHIICRAHIICHAVYIICCATYNLVCRAPQCITRATISPIANTMQPRPVPPSRSPSPSSLPPRRRRQPLLPCGCHHPPQCNLLIQSPEFPVPIELRSELWGRARQGVDVIVAQLACVGRC